MGQRGSRTVDGWGRVLGGLWSLLLATTIVLAGSAGPASAHTDLVRSFPEAGAELSAPVTELWLEFEAPMVEEESEVAVTGPGGASKVVGEPTVTGNVIQVQVPPMTEAGGYRVSYRVTSLDGHLLAGDYRFSIRAEAAEEPVVEAPAEPAATASPADPEIQASPPSAAAGAAQAGTGEPSFLWVGVGSMLLAVAGSAFVVHRTRGRTRGREPSGQP